VTDTLFDPEQYGEGSKTRKRKEVPPVAMVQRPPGYHLISNTKGVQGFHRSKIPEAAMASHGSVVTYCGILGRRMDFYPKEIPLCSECERVNNL
jgi:hypothetical protein